MYEVNEQKKSDIQKEIYTTLYKMVKKLESDRMTYMEGVDIAKIVADKFAPEIIKYCTYLCFENKEKGGKNDRKLCKNGTSCKGI